MLLPPVPPERWSRRATVTTKELSLPLPRLGRLVEAAVMSSVAP